MAIAACYSTVWNHTFFNNLPTVLSYSTFKGHLLLNSLDLKGIPQALAYRTRHAVIGELDEFGHVCLSKGHWMLKASSRSSLSFLYFAVLFFLWLKSYLKSSLLRFSYSSHWPKKRWKWICHLWLLMCCVIPNAITAGCIVLISHNAGGLFYRLGKCD